MSKELKIESYIVRDWCGDYEIELWLGSEIFLEFQIKMNATPEQFIKHLRSMIYHIEKKVEENEY